MTAIYKNFVGGTLSANLLTAGTTMTSPALGSVPVITAPDTMTIVLDPDGLAGAPEIVLITAHALDSSTATVVRAQEGTVARDHLIRTDWVHSFTAGWVSSLTVPEGSVPSQVNAPIDPDDYDLWFDTDGPDAGGSATPVLKYFDPATSTWRILTNGSGGAILTQAEAPAEPTEGMIWLDTDEMTITRPNQVRTFAGAKVYANTAVPVANAIMVPVTFDATRFDADNLHNPAVNSDRVLLDRVGFWRVTAALAYATNANGDRRLRIHYNSSLWSQANVRAAASETIVSHSDVIEATSPTDYVSVYAHQTSGVTLNVLATPETFLAVEYLGAS